MADLLIKPEHGAAGTLSESRKKKLERNRVLATQKNTAIAELKKRNRETREALKIRTLQYEEEYQTEQENALALRRESRAEGGFYKEPDAQLIFAIRIKGINKLAPKPRKVLQLFRLLQIHNGVFIKVNKATTEMLKLIAPFVTYGYPSLKTVRELIYKRGYGKVNKHRIPLQDNQIISEALGKYGIHGVEDLVHEIYTVGPHFKEANNFLWPFKLNSPRGGFVAKRHGFTEPRGGDWGNRELLINSLLTKMI